MGDDYRTVSAWEKENVRLRAQLASDRERIRALEDENSRIAGEMTSDASDHAQSEGEHRREAAELRDAVSDAQEQAQLATDLHRRSLVRGRELTAQLQIFGEDLARLYREKLLRRAKLLPLLWLAPIVALSFVVGALAGAFLLSDRGVVSLADRAEVPIATGAGDQRGRVVVVSSDDPRLKASEAAGVPCLCPDGGGAEPAIGTLSPAILGQQQSGVRADQGRPTPRATPSAPSREVSVTGMAAAPTFLARRTASPRTPEAGRAALTASPALSAQTPGTGAGPTPTPEPARVPAAPGSPGRAAAEIVLDASGSMRDRLGSGTKISQAKAATSWLIASAPDDISLGLRVYGPPVGDHAK